MTAFEQLHKRLEELAMNQNILLVDSLKAADAGLFRAAHVLAWGGFIDLLCDCFAIDSVKNQYPKWQIESTEDLHRVKEDQLIEAGKKLGLYNNSILTTLKSLLNERNQLAHGPDTLLRPMRR